MIKFPIKLIYSEEIVKHAVNHLNCKVMQMCSTPLFIFIAESGTIYAKDNAIEFGVSGYTFVEQRDFLKEQRVPTLTGLNVCLIPKEGSGTILLFKVAKSNFNYVSDYDGKTYYKGNYTVIIMNNTHIDLLRSWGVIR